MGLLPYKIFKAQILMHQDVLLKLWAVYSKYFFFFSMLGKGTEGDRRTVYKNIECFIKHNHFQLLVHVNQLVYKNNSQTCGLYYCTTWSAWTNLHLGNEPINEFQVVNSVAFGTSSLVPFLFISISSKNGDIIYSS